jgi:NADPH2:quinone reductase
MTRVIRVHQPGGPEALQWEELDLPDPGPGQVRVRNTAVGVNFIDVYHRTGLYPQPLPFTPGPEAAGVVEAVGPGVTDFRIGDRVAYGAGPLGSYAEARLYPADRLLHLPNWIDDRTAAAMMLQGMTAQYLLRRTYRVQPGDIILVHAAAGGVGLILCQWARALGATVIGTVGSDDKAERARAAGCHHPIVYTREDFVTRVRDITDGKGCAVVYDSVGRDTFNGSLDCTRRLGLVAAFGQSSGPVPPIDLATLNAKGSLFLTRPSLFNYTAERDELTASAAELFAMVHSGEVKIHVNHEYALKDAAQAHRDLEGRRTTGSIVLIP